MAYDKYTIAKATDAVKQATKMSMELWNKQQGKSWDWGTSWTNVGSDFETYINKYLFPKIQTTDIIQIDLTNRFDWLAKEMTLVGQLSEEYVIADSVPVNLTLTKSADLMLKQKYPQMITKLYAQGNIRKMKFTLNDNDVRLNFQNLADGVAYALAVYRKAISDINYNEELEMKAMLVDYANNQATDIVEVASMQDLFDTMFNKMLDFQDSSDKHHEAVKASGGNLLRYTTKTALKDIIILTTNKAKTYALNSRIANTFNTAGIDMTQKLMSFSDLGGVYELTADVKITDSDSLAKMQAMGDYQVEVGDVIPEGSVIAYDVSSTTDFKGKVKEIKPITGDEAVWAYIFDAKKIRYKRNTANMWKKPFENPEFVEQTHWLHYYTQKNMSPFYNSCVLRVAQP